MKTIRAAVPCTQDHVLVLEVPSSVMKRPVFTKKNRIIKTSCTTEKLPLQNQPPKMVLRQYESVAPKLYPKNYAALYQKRKMSIFAVPVSLFRFRLRNTLYGTEKLRHKHNALLIIESSRHFIHLS